MRYFPLAERSTMFAALATISTWNKMNSSDRSPGGLLKLSVGALVAALLAMVLFVLPAEYDTDPTGLGEIMGIKGMSGYQVGALTTQSTGVHQDQSSFWLAPFESVEYKYTLSEGQMHSEIDADPEQSVTFELSRGDAQRGTFVAPFSGVHGWYWENRGVGEVEVMLQATGFFTQGTTYGPSGAFTKVIGKDAEPKTAE
jgi:hypothetical protein